MGAGGVGSAGPVQGREAVLEAGAGRTVLCTLYCTDYEEYVGRSCHPSIWPPQYARSVLSYSHRPSTSPAVGHRVIINHQVRTIVPRQLAVLGRVSGGACLRAWRGVHACITCCLRYQWSNSLVYASSPSRFRRGHQGKTKHEDERICSIHFFASYLWFFSQRFVRSVVGVGAAGFVDRQPPQTDKVQTRYRHGNADRTDITDRHTSSLSRLVDRQVCRQTDRQK